MKNVILFSDTVPPVILKEALLAAGFRLRGFYTFPIHQWPRLKFRNVITEIRIGFCCLTQWIIIHCGLFFSSFHLFYYTQSDKENGIFQAIVAFKKAFNLPKAPVHISDLSRNYAFRRKRFFLVGAPGSGNMIFLRICGEILKQRASRPFSAEADPIGEFLQRQALLYMAFVKFRIQEALKPYYISDAVGPEGFGRCYYSGNVFRTKAPKSKVKTEIGGIMIGALPLNHQAWANPLHSCHLNLSTKDIDLFHKSNTDVIQIIRHPLDNLLSITSKIAFDCAPTASAHLREVWIRKLLNTEGWFITLFEAIRKYYENVLDNKPLVKLIKYEGLFENPKETIVEMASYLQESISADLALNLWASSASKRLNGGPGHRWKPGCEKWIRFIPRKYQGLFQSSNLKEICCELGYDTPNFSRLPVYDDVSIPNESNEVLALKEIHYYILINKQPYFKHPNIRLFEDPITGLKVGGLSSHVNAVRKMVENGALF